MDRPQAGRPGQRHAVAGLHPWRRDQGCRRRRARYALVHLSADRRGPGVDQCDPLHADAAVRAARQQHRKRPGVGPQTAPGRRAGAGVRRGGGRLHRITRDVPHVHHLRRCCGYRYFGSVMSRAIHVFRSPDRFVPGTVGQPGNRTFYLQAVHDARIVSVVLEKQQVAVLAERIGALLIEVNRRFGTPIPPAPGAVADLNPLVTPIDAEFRVGTMGLGWDSEAQTVVVELLAVTDTEFDASVVLDDAEEGPDAGRGLLTPASARQFAARSNAVISAGRPPCPLCDEPLDPAGHICVRTNGYRRGALDGSADDAES